MILEKIICKSKIRSALISEGIAGDEVLNAIVDDVYEYIVEHDGLESYIRESIWVHSDSKDVAQMDGLSENDSVKNLEMSLLVDEGPNGEYYVQFSLSYGLGSGAQRFPLAVFGEFIQFLENFKSSGKDMVRQTPYKVDFGGGERDCVWSIHTVNPAKVALRTYTGRGSKPSFFNLDDLEEIIENFRKCEDAAIAALKRLKESG